MHVAVAMLMQMFTNNFARCEVEVYGSFCQSVEYNSPLAYCPVPLRLNLDKRDVLRDRERVQAKAAQVAGAPSSAWFELACTSGALDYNQFHQPVPPRGGVSWRERSIMAALEGARRGDTMSLHYLEALLLVQSAVGRADADVGYAAMHRILTVVGELPEDHLNAYARETVTLLEHRVHHTPSDGSASRACTSLALDTGDYNTAHECALVSLAQGRDSTWNLLRIAWLAFRRGDSAGGAAFFELAGTVARDRTSAIDLGWHFKTGVDAMQVWGFEAGGKRDSGLVAERLHWLDLPAAKRLPWITARAQTTDGARNWIALDDHATVAAHFAAVAFVGEGFRDCVDGEKVPPCAGAHEPIAQRLRFWDEHGAAVVVMPYHLAASQWPPKAGTGALTVALRQWDDALQEMHDSSWVESAQAKGEKVRDGIIIAASSPALTSWSLEWKGSSGDRVGDFQDLQSRIDAAPVIVSDLALGSLANGIPWEHAEHRTLIATSSTFDRREKLELFFQVRCDTNCGATQTSFALYPLPLRASGKPALAFTTEGAIARGVTDVERELDLSRLQPGMYRVEVQVNAGAEHGVIRRSLNIVLK